MRISPSKSWQLGTVYISSQNHGYEVIAWIWIALGAVVAAAIVVAIILLKKKRAKMLEDV